MDIDFIISDLEKSLGSHANCILSSFSTKEHEEEGQCQDPLDDIIRDFEANCTNIASFYTQLQNNVNTCRLSKISNNFVDAPSQQAPVMDVLHNVKELTARQLESIVAGEASISRTSANAAIVAELLDRVRHIQSSSLKRLKRLSSSKNRRLISFGKLRAWASDVMRQTGGENAPTFETISKCARLRRRLTRLFHLAQTCHVFKQNLVSEESPLVARLNQDLMRIRLQLALRMRQPQLEDHDSLRLSENPIELSRRFECISFLPPIVASSRLENDLEKLTDNLTDLLICLAGNKSDVQKAFGFTVPLTAEKRSHLRSLVRRSISSFCTFYSKSVAAEFGSPKKLSLSTLLSQSDYELEEISASDTECMMDAFDVFDSFVTNTNAEAASNDGSIDSDISASDEGNTNKLPEAVVPPAGAAKCADTGSQQIEDGPAPDDHSTSPREDASPVVSTADSPPTRTASPTSSSSSASSPHRSPSGRSLSRSRSPADRCTSSSSDEDEDEHEEGEIVELDEDSDAAHDGTHASPGDVLSDIDQTEQAIMDEWAPMSADKPQPKLSFDTIVQRTVEDAKKSCQRQLQTVITLDSGLQNVSPITSASKANGQFKKTTPNSSTPLKPFPPNYLRYTRQELLRIRTKAFMSYIKQSCLSSSGPESIDWSAVEETQTIHVDYPSLLTSESLKKRIADWPTDANGESPPNARVILQSLGLAVHTVASRQIDIDSAPGKEFLHPWLRVHHSQLGFVAVRLVGHYPTLPMRSLRANHLGRLVSIRGTVARLGPIKPLCIRLAFRCSVCENEQVLVLGEDGGFIQPTKCPEKGCRSKSFVPLFESASTQVVDTRSMILQESEEGFADERDNRSNLQLDSTGSFPTSSSSSGRVPRSIPCSLDRDLVSSCVPGDFVHVVGVVSLLPAESSISQSGSSHQPISSLESGRRCAQANFFNICLRVNNMTLIYGRSGGSTDSGDSNDGGQIHGGIHRGAVQCLTSRNASLGGIQGQSDLVNPSQAMVGSKSDSYFSLSDLYAIRGLSESQDLFRLLIASFCPSICGRELVKMAIMLTLLGASTLSPSVDPTRAPEEEEERSPSLSLSSDADSCEELQTDRSDPGIGKSQLLRAAANAAPRAVYVCGNATSAAGLTVSTGRDQSGSGFGLEAGALVLADQGCCCIDEFDKISCDPASLLEVLEQQTVSVARGGFVCNLAARTSVMAAANPVVGHYDASKSVEENVRISRSLLSRFDLIFILPDRPSEGQDRRLSEHILSLHTGKQRDRFVFGGNVSAADASAIGQESKESLEVRLQLPSGFDYSRLISPILLRKLTERAARVLRDYYIELRKLRRDQDVFRATIRQLESLLRLASARARAELREEILEEDAKDVCDLMRETLFGTPAPPGVCDVSVCSLGVLHGRQITYHVA
nr:unnamed protein product [Spirometra erinaceieuropaei]